ncbi:MAG: hypothetical protein U0802_25380 [Candidatus Binatia bacterium]
MPTSVATVWFENRLGEEPYRHRQDGDTLRIEAEHFTDQRDGTWYKQSRYAGFSGDGYAQDHNSQAATPRAWADTRGMTYAIEVSGGTYAVWLRRLIPTQWGRALGGERSNSVWLGADDQPPAAPVDDVAAPTEQWAWVRAGSLALSRGRHTLTLKTREGGYAVDQILLTTDPDSAPM